MIWIIVGVIVVAILLFAGFLPLPNQQDKVTTLTEPSPQGHAPKPEQPTRPSGNSTAGKQVPPGGEPVAPKSIPHG